MMEELGDVWTDDLFDRQSEADDLVGYLESVVGRPPIREDSHAHVMAIDTAYGHGKTFFLRRLDRHLKATKHVSAYVDAWVDDLEDQPMVALAATLECALSPWAGDSNAIAEGLREFKSKAGKVAKIVGLGLAKRAAGFIITQGAAEAVGEVLSEAKEDTREAVKVNSP
ncbi:P-loop NTPase fold protein [Breoghania sp.]|uniref:P-loop NTPase fold protein n=1 Tax=Breoghania sp. TaxID=2065378 RepID=UPI002AA905DA|nr:P-loop NTPase fold protein [Breoghania sp.]